MAKVLKRILIVFLCVGFLGACALVVFLVDENLKLRDTLAPFLKAEEDRLADIARDPARKIYSKEEYDAIKYAFDNANTSFQYLIVYHKLAPSYGAFLKLSLEDQVIIIKKLLWGLTQKKDQSIWSLVLQNNFGFSPTVAENILACCKQKY